LTWQSADITHARSKFWESGTALMLTAALISSVGALIVALIDARVPVFEIVVRHYLATPFIAICAGAQKLLLAPQP
jgi:hypothetical protein